MEAMRTSSLRAAMGRQACPSLSSVRQWSPSHTAKRRSRDYKTSNHLTKLTSNHGHSPRSQKHLQQQQHYYSHQYSPAAMDAPSLSAYRCCFHKRGENFPFSRTEGSRAEGSSTKGLATEGSGTEGPSMEGLGRSNGMKGLIGHYTAIEWDPSKNGYDKLSRKECSLLPFGRFQVHHHRSQCKPLPTSTASPMTLMTLMTLDLRTD